jgi:phosphonate transport system ATP-binding protein
MELLREITLSKKIGTLAVLHQPEMAGKYATRVIGIKDGLVCYDGSPNLSEIGWSRIYGQGNATSMAASSRQIAAADLTRICQ